MDNHRLTDVGASTFSSDASHFSIDDVISGQPLTCSTFFYYFSLTHHVLCDVIMVNKVSTIKTMKTMWYVTLLPRNEEQRLRP